MRIVVDMFNDFRNHLNSNNETLLQILKKHYFCYVKNPLHINFRKLVAGLLLALLVFIYAEKAFHIHHNTHNNKQQAGVYAISNNTICNICDFTIAKDAGLPNPVTIEIPVTFLLKKYIVAAASYHYLADDYVSNRGPPSL